jgi:TPR repeat protein
LERDYQKAAKLLAEAMTRGAPLAKRVLADCYDKGIGVVQDKERAKILREDKA